MSTMVRWFPDRPGLISGVLLMGFGGGSFLIGKLYQAWTPTGVGGWRTSFLVLGIVCFAVLAVNALAGYLDRLFSQKIFRREVRS